MAAAQKMALRMMPDEQGQLKVTPIHSQARAARVVPRNAGRVGAQPRSMTDDEYPGRFVCLHDRAGSEREIALACAATLDGGEQLIDRAIGCSPSRALDPDHVQCRPNALRFVRRHSAQRATAVHCQGDPTRMRKDLRLAAP
jgi:hypothetical protein